MTHDRPAEPVETPKECPFCASPEVSATGKSVTSSSYWRCGACGEVWNPGRSAEPAPHAARW
jgi:transposase-like protein